MLSKEEIDRAFSLDEALRHVDAIFERTLGSRGAPMYKAVVHVTLKRDVLDPQGKAIQNACASLGHASVASVRQGKLFELELEAQRRSAGARASCASCARSCSRTR